MAVVISTFFPRRVAMSLLSPYFLQVHNLLSMTQYGAVIGLLALGQSLVILGGNGGIDLSVWLHAQPQRRAHGLMTQYGGLKPLAGRRDHPGRLGRAGGGQRRSGSPDCPFRR